MEASEGRERDALIAEHIVGMPRIVSLADEARREEGRDRPYGGYLLSQHGQINERWRFLKPEEEVERAHSFWWYMDASIPHYGEDMGLALKALSMVLPVEEAVTGGGSLIRGTIPRERHHRVTMSSAVTGNGMFAEWTVRILSLNGESVCGASGPLLPDITARALETLIRVENWKNGRRTR